MMIAVLLTLGGGGGGGGTVTVSLSNTKLPVDTNGQPLQTGEVQVSPLPPQ